MGLSRDWVIGSALLSDRLTRREHCAAGFHGPTSDVTRPPAKSCPGVKGARLRGMRRTTPMATLAVEDRTALTDALRRLLADRCTEADVRRTMETDSGYDPALWKQLAEMGVIGLIINEAYGGAGAGPMELERVFEEAGAALLCPPLLSMAVLKAGCGQ